MITTFSGITEPFQPPEPYALIGNRSPALRGFRLTFDGGRDKEISLMEAYVGGDSIDLSPTAFLPALNLPDGKLSVALQDAAPSGEAFGYTISHALLSLPGARRFQIRDTGAIGKINRRLPGVVFSQKRFRPREPHILALAGFRLFFTGQRDRRLKTVGIWFENDELHVEFADKSANANDTFTYFVDFISIPTQGINSSTVLIEGNGSNASSAAAPPAIGRQEAFLSGWRLEFSGNSDNEIRYLGIELSNKRVDAIFSDRGGNDKFDWKVWQSIAGPMEVALA